MCTKMQWCESKCWPKTIQPNECVSTGTVKDSPNLDNTRAWDEVDST